MSATPLVILLAEDDEGHAFLVRKNLERLGIANSIVHVMDGQSAVDYVQRRGAFSGRSPHGPLLVVLDINMPRLDGVEVLSILKGADSTAKIPVVILTTTDDPREIDRCYQLGCSVYITKPVEYDSFAEAVRRLGLFLQVVRVPDEAVGPPDAVHSH